MNVDTCTREEIKAYFVKDAFPTERNFADFIDATLNQNDDGIAKPSGRPLSLEALRDATGEQPVIDLYHRFADDRPAWRLSLNPMRDPNNFTTARSGLHLSNGYGESRLFIDSDRGFVGIKTIDPRATLEVNGTIKAAAFEGDGSNLEGIQPSRWLDGKNSGDIHYSGGNVGIGTDEPHMKLEVNGNVSAEIVYARTIYASRVEANGQELTPSKDDKWSDGQPPNTIVYTTGNVGIGTTDPQEMLEVNGTVKAEAFTGDGSGLEGVLTTDDKTWAHGAQPNDIYYDGGNVGIGTTDPQEMLEVNGTIKAGTFVGDGSGLEGVLTADDMTWAHGAQPNDIYYDGGNVGIGTANPRMKLEVNGTIRAAAFVGDGSGLKGILTAAELKWADGIKPGNIYYAGGNVGIGTNIPEKKLQVESGELRVRASHDDPISNIGTFHAQSLSQGIGIGCNRIEAIGTDDDQDILFLPKGAGNVGIGTVAPGYALDVRGMMASHGMVLSGDSRLKRDINPLPGALGTVSKLQGVSYEWRMDEFPENHFWPGRRLGLIGQDVETVLPEIVSTSREGYKMIDYASLSALLIEAIKEQKGLFDAQWAEIARLRAKLDGQSS